jgi:hypothetical protein
MTNGGQTAISSIRFAYWLLRLETQHRVRLSWAVAQLSEQHRGQ